MAFSLRYHFDLSLPFHTLKIYARATSKPEDFVLSHGVRVIPKTLFISPFNAALPRAKALHKLKGLFQRKRKQMQRGAKSEYTKKPSYPRVQTRPEKGAHLSSHAFFSFLSFRLEKRKGKKKVSFHPPSKTCALARSMRLMTRSRWQFFLPFFVPLKRDGATCGFITRE